MNILAKIISLGWLSGARRFFSLGEKTWVDVLGVLLVPIVLAGVSLVIQRQLEANARADRIAQEEQQQLQGYLDTINDLVLTQGINNALLPGQGNDLERANRTASLRAVASAKTITTLRELDGVKKKFIVSFLYELGLVNGASELVPLTGADLKNAELGGLDLFGINLQGAILDGANLDDTRLTVARLGNASVKNVTLRRALLVDAKLDGADLTGSDLSDARLNNASLFNTNLSETTLTGTDFQGALLSFADLRLASFDNTSFIRADLRNADLRGANVASGRFDDAKFAGALFCNDQREVITAKADVAEAKFVDC